MEDTLRACEDGGTGRTAKVLILVLMEDTLRAGFYIEKVQITCLNPCFNGRYSQRVSLLSFVMMRMVLILVLMEDTLRDA